ncbi:hypothetical protein Glove_372g95 [Diversispora epigaea]|uniref:Uncharacterized protein n=1 Tax=Diversispora epigaea TaxID=1348612 RepID=A0A397HAA1_9GLOM|nr:hypothetical protein Glove_372g95 [Diversispora epigaea]
MYSIASGSWIELFQFSYQCCQSFSLLEVTEVCVDNLQQLLQMFTVVLNDPETCINDGDNDSVIKDFELLLVDISFISRYFPQLIEFPSQSVMINLFV